MKERMQNTSAHANGCPQRDRTASEGYVGAQTYMEIVEGELVEMHFEGQGLMEQIIDLDNLRTAYRQVVRNKGKGGVDGMEVRELFSWCKSHIEDLRHTLMDGTYVPDPVRRAEIPKGNGKKRLLGIPTVIDRMVQQAISQVLSRIYEPQFSRTSYGFRPKRGAHDALRRPLRRRLQYSVHHHPAAEVLVYQRYYAAVIYRSAQHLYQFALVYRVEEALQVDAHGIPVPFGHVLPCLTQCIMCSTFGRNP